VQIVLGRQPAGDDDARMTIRLRPHRVLCSIGFEGEGYDDAFLANMSRVVDGQLRAPGGEDQVVRITGEADAICAPCPQRRGSGCVKQAVIDRIDARHGEILGLAPGDVTTWGDCLERARERVAPEALDHLCEGCRWLPRGMCKAALAALSDAEMQEGRPKAAPETTA
jgi:hypothetical protein